MTSDSEASGDQIAAADGTDDPDLARWEEATRIREQRPGWVVIWLAERHEFRAYPLFRAPLGSFVSTAQASELETAIDDFELAVRNRQRRSPGSTAAPEGSAQHPGGA